MTTHGVYTESILQHNIPGTLIYSIILYIAHLKHGGKTSLHSVVGTVNLEHLGLPKKAMIEQYIRTDQSECIVKCCPPHTIRKEDLEKNFCGGTEFINCIYPRLIFTIKFLLNRQTQFAVNKTTRQWQKRCGLTY